MKDSYHFKGDISSVFTIFCLSIALVLIVIMSFGARFFYRPGVDDSFWGDLAFLCAITIYSLYFGISEGKKYFEKKEGGRYQVSIADFKAARKQVKEKDFTFEQWLDVYYQREKKDYFISLVTEKSSHINAMVFDLDYNELDKLENPYLKNWDDTDFKGRAPTVFRSLTKEQIRYIKRIFEGKVKFAKIPASYFKTYDTKVARSEYKQHAEESKRESLQTVGLIGYRLVMLFLTQLIFAIFGIKIMMSESTEEVLENIYNTFSRVMNLATGFSWGWMIGRLLIIRNAQKIEYKTRINEQFLSDKTFEGISEEELAQKEYADYLRQLENEKITKLPFKEGGVV